MPMRHASVSLVVPMRDEAATVVSLLAGLAAQTVAPRELIFVDAGSRDGSAQRVRDWWAARGWEGTDCRVIEEPGAFPGAGRNAGVRASGEPWIAFLDCGIVPEPAWLESLVACAESSPGAGALGECRFEGAGAWGRAFCALSYGEGTRRPVLPASLFRRSLFERVGYFEPALRAGEDLLWLGKVRSAGEVLGECAAAQGVYGHFPGSLPAGARKWFDYERSVSAAGIGGWRRRIGFGAGLLLYAVPVVAPTVGAALWIAYALLRGVVDPIRRSERRWWWRGEPLALLCALPAAIVVDTGRALGSVAGLFARAPRR
jgi:hypothetical protein